MNPTTKQTSKKFQAPLTGTCNVCEEHIGIQILLNGKHEFQCPSCSARLAKQEAAEEQLKNLLHPAVSEWLEFCAGNLAEDQIDMQGITTQIQNAREVWYQFWGSELLIKDLKEIDTYVTTHLHTIHRAEIKIRKAV